MHGHFASWSCPEVPEGSYQMNNTLYTMGSSRHLATSLDRHHDIVDPLGTFHCYWECGQLDTGHHEVPQRDLRYSKQTGGTQVTHFPSNHPGAP